MATLMLLISAFCCILTFGIHWKIMTEASIDKPMYVHNPFLCAIPVICGFILPVIAFSYAFPWHWAIIFFVNLVIVFMSARLLATLVLAIFWRRKDRNLGFKAYGFFLTSMVTLFAGILLFYFLP